MDLNKLEDKNSSSKSNNYYEYMEKRAKTFEDLEKFYADPEVVEKIMAKIEQNNRIK